MFKFLSFILVLFSLEAKIQNKTELKKNHNKGTEVKCKDFVNGEFEDYDTDGNLIGKIVRDGKNSYYRQVNTDLKTKSEIYIDSNCIMRIKRLKINGASVTEEEIKNMLKFDVMEKIYKVKKNKGYYSDLMNKPKGYYKKIN